MEKMARVGLISKGITYCLTGALALMAALHVGNSQSSDADKTGVFSFLEDQPMGTPLLLLLALGLLCYACWRAIQCFGDTENKGSDLKGWGHRAAYLFSGIIYLFLAFLAGRMALGQSTGGGGDNRVKLASELMEHSYGQIIAGIIAIMLIGYGFMQFRKVFSGKYKKDVQEGQYRHPDASKWILRAGRIGYSARGIVWLIIGWLFLKAAVKGSPNEAGDTGKVFQWIEAGPFGSIMLGLVAAGLVCYGIFMFVRAAYQKV
ncbi:MAG: DUF1206 domain-containing protein [Sphingobacteriales bacterium]|nr:MAG: DUF1206 domain-containing protein [Sphingobacteriales bacterium]